MWAPIGNWRKNNIDYRTSSFQVETILSEPLHDIWTHSNPSDDHKYNAGGPLRSSSDGNVDISVRFLRISGAFYGQISTVKQLTDARDDYIHEYYPLHLNINSSIKPKTSFWDSICNAILPLIAKDRMEEGSIYNPDHDIHVWRTLLTDQFPGPESRGLPSRMSFDEDALGNFYSSLRQLIVCSGSRLQQPPFDGVLVRTLRLVASRKAFCTSTILNSADIGLLLAAPEVQVDDCIFVVRGCSYPLIVRPASKRGITRKTNSRGGKGRTDRESYQLFGCGAVAGIMDGQVINEIARGNLEEEELLLV